MSKYSDVRKGSAPTDPGDEMMVCRYCRGPARRSEMSTYGARCKKCFDAYCSASMAEFNARFKRSEPQKALPRRPGRLTGQEIGAAMRPARETIAAWADQMGIDVDPVEADRRWRDERGIALPQPPAHHVMPDGRPEPDEEAP